MKLITFAAIVAITSAHTICLTPNFTSTFQVQYDNFIVHGKGSFTFESGCASIEEYIHYRSDQPHGSQLLHVQYYMSKGISYIYDPAKQTCTSLGKVQQSARCLFAQEAYNISIGHTPATLYLGNSQEGSKQNYFAWVSHKTSFGRRHEQIFSLMNFTADAHGTFNTISNATTSAFFNFVPTAHCMAPPVVCHAHEEHPDAAYHRHRFEELVMRVAPTHHISHAGPKEVKPLSTPTTENIVEAPLKATKHCPSTHFATPFIYSAKDAGVTGHMYYDFSNSHNVKARFDEKIKLTNNSTMQGSLYHLNGINYWVQSDSKGHQTCQNITTWVPVDCFLATTTETTFAMNEVVHIYRTYNSHKNVTNTSPMATLVMDTLGHPLLHTNLTQTWDKQGKFTGTAYTILYYNTTSIVSPTVFTLPSICDESTNSDDLPEGFQQSAAAKMLFKL
jgi:hypothetical protein